MSEREQPQPKIIVDEDYKARVQAEKEAAARAQAAKRGAASGGEQRAGQGRTAEDPAPQRDVHGAEGLPPASFAALVNQLAVQAAVALGVIRTEPPASLDLPMARYLIDTLQVLEDKTRGNLSEPEAQLLERTLHELRMTYVTVQKP